MANKTKTADVLIEIGCEELPAAELYQLIDDFATAMQSALYHSHLEFKSIDKFATPRRLALIIRDLQTKQEDRKIDRRGPSLQAAYTGDDNKPTQAALGFAQSCGVKLEDLTTLKTDKGEYLVANIMQKGMSVQQLLPTMLNELLPKLSKSRTMSWGDDSQQFVRPIRWLLALVDKEVLAWEMFGLQASNKTYGHRFYCDKEISIKHADDYENALVKQGYVIASPDKRKDAIVKSIAKLTKESGLVTSPAFTDKFLDDLVAITEYPVGYLGEFDKEFLALPPEVLDSVLILKQYYIPLVDKKGDVSPKFIFIANIDSKDPQLLIEGNQAVVRPRLADAAFFYQEDKSQTLQDRLDELDRITFVEKLGSIKNKADCCKDLAEYLADALGWQDVAEAAKQAAELSKCDLTSLMVQEFPELQGTMGKYYLQGHDKNAKKNAETNIASASIAIEEHYLPRFAGDKIAESKAGKLVALADRIDTLVGLFHAGYKPTSEKDPYGLRRTALGLARTIIESEISLDLHDLGKKSIECYGKHNKIKIDDKVLQDVIAFINERVISYGKEKNIASDILDGVFYQSQKDIYDAWLKVQAINDKRSEYVNSLIGINKRLKNILKNISDKQPTGNAEVKQELFESEYEHKVFKTLQKIYKDFDSACDAKEYVKCLELLSGLSSPLEEFFDQVMVMADDKQVRENRLLLLSEVHRSFLRIADFSHLVV